MKAVYPLASRRAIIVYSLLALMIFSFTASGQTVEKKSVSRETSMTSSVAK
jgi:hypothetical protein